MLRKLWGILGGVVGILAMAIAKRIKGTAHEEDKAGVGNGVVRGDNSVKRERLSRQASRALDEKMDAEDPRFGGTKYW